MHKHSSVLSLRPQSSLCFVHRPKDKFWIDGWLSAKDSSHPWRSPVRLNKHSIVSNNYSHRYITLFYIFASAHFNWFDDGPKFQIYYSVFVFPPFLHLERGWKRCRRCCWSNVDKSRYNREYIWCKNLANKKTWMAKESAFHLIVHVRARELFNFILSLFAFIHPLLQHDPTESFSLFIGFCGILRLITLYAHL